MCWMIDKNKRHTHHVERARAIGDKRKRHAVSGQDTDFDRLANRDDPSTALRSAQDFIRVKRCVQTRFYRSRHDPFDQDEPPLRVTMQAKARCQALRLQNEPRRANAPRVAQPPANWLTMPFGHITIERQTISQTTSFRKSAHFSAFDRTMPLTIGGS